MAYKNLDYKPSCVGAEILDAAYKHIQSVPYAVSVRWVFYRLLQDGFYKEKSDYKLFIQLTSRARHTEYKDWRPDTLADGTREIIAFNTAGLSPDIDIEEQISEGKETAFEDLMYAKTAYQRYMYQWPEGLDPKYYQDYICVILYEARAMTEQFKTYTHGITLCAFGGQPSISLKWDIAKFIEYEAERYDKPAVVLYFGDLDDAGGKIYNTGKNDISGWCQVPIDFVHCGLNERQVKKYKLPENFEHPGYQWEALTDPQARQIITAGLKPYYNPDAMEMAHDEERAIRDQINGAVNVYVNELREMDGHKA